MDADSITLDKGTFKALASETRVHILKSLDQRRKTASELSHELGTTVQGISEHLHSLQHAGLVERKESGRKWVYYQLTGKGGAVLHPDSKKFWVLVSLSLLALFSYFYSPFFAGFGSALSSYENPQALIARDTASQTTNRIVSATPTTSIIQEPISAAPETMPAKAQSTPAVVGAEEGRQKALDNAPQIQPSAPPVQVEEARAPSTSVPEAVRKAEALSQWEALSLVAAALFLAGAGWIKFVKKSA